MTIVKNLNHLNLNTGEKTGIEVLFADWLNVEEFVNQRTERGGNMIDDLVIKIEWGPGAALVRLVNKEDSPVSVHAVAVTDEASDIIWRIIEVAWLQEGEKHPWLHANNHAYPDIEQMKLPWVVSLFGMLWHRLSDDRKAKAYHHAKIVVGAVYRELRGRERD
jgi:hypothetical protein